mmetsp:Transcript_62082/g.110620  ORF Transcript_62082/g.110620 Transcript_62082/m.110620 type:complete len:222 (-) Transcript_62082:141-806(-)
MARHKCSAICESRNPSPIAARDKLQQSNRTLNTIPRGVPGAAEVYPVVEAVITPKLNQKPSAYAQPSAAASGPPRMALQKKFHRGSTMSKTPRHLHMASRLLICLPGVERPNLIAMGSITSPVNMLRMSIIKARAHAPTMALKAVPLDVAGTTLTMGFVAVAARAAMKKKPSDKVQSSMAAINAPRIRETRNKKTGTARSMKMNSCTRAARTDCSAAIASS